MNHTLSIRILSAAAAISYTLAMASCSHHHDEHHDHEAHSETEAHSASAKEEESTPGGGAMIHLDPERAATLGVGTDTVAPGLFYETVTVGGRLEGAPEVQSAVAARSSGIVHLAKGITPGAEVKAGQVIATVSGEGMEGGDANESAAVALRAAKRELDRLTPLHEEGIVSTRDYNAALQAYDAARAAMGNSRGKGSTAVAPTAGVVVSVPVREGEFVTAGAPIAVVDGMKELTLRADLPERYLSFLPSLSGAKFTTPYSPEALDISDFSGRRISGNTAVGGAGYIPVYFLLNNNGTLTPGTNCSVTLLGGRREGVISVPEQALTEQQGQLFVFVNYEPGHYEKRPVTAGAKAGTEVEITHGLTPGEQVVTHGTQFVKLAENAGAAVPGHTHNH